MARSRAGNTTRRCSCQKSASQRPCHNCSGSSSSVRKYRASIPPQRPVACSAPLDTFGALHAQLSHIEATKSPESTLSLISYDTDVSSNVTTGSVTIHSSPGYDFIPTPTGSEASYDVSEYQYQIQQPTAQIYSPHHQGASSQLVEATQGLTNFHQFGPQEGDYFLYNQVQFVSPTGPFPAPPQRYPQLDVPWAGLPLRHHAPIVREDTVDLSMPDVALSPASSNERSGRRNGPLSPAARKKANDVRQVGACLRCQYMKEPCDSGFPCKNCQTKQSRKWKLGCIRGTLESSKHCLFPSELVQRYERLSMNKHMHRGVWSYAESNTTFTLKLDMGFPGSRLGIQCKEIDPCDLRNRTVLRAFQAVREESTSRVEQQEIWDPPILPYLPQLEGELHLIHRQIRNWLNSAIFQPYEVQEGQLSWPWHCFDDPQVYWGGEVMELIQRYYRSEIAEHKVLREALCLPFFSYLLGHPFEVHQDDLGELLGNLQNPPPAESLYGKVVSSEDINRFLKVLIFKLAKENAEKVLKALHEMLDGMAKGRNITAARKNLAFCLAFLLILFVGKIQVIIHELGLLSTNEPEVGFTAADGERMIRTIESQVAEYIIRLHEFAVQKKKTASSFSARPNQSDEHAESFEFMRQLREIRQRCRAYTPCTHANFVAEVIAGDDDRPSSMKLSEIDRDTFGIFNAHRLCWKLYESAFGDGQ